MPAPGPTLRPIHVPAPDAWPPAPGWWLLTGVVLALGGWLAWRRWRQRRRRRQWRQAVTELDVLQRQYARDHDGAAFAAGVSALLRRAVREDAPALLRLHGAAWWDAVQGQVGDTGGVDALRSLDDIMYRASADLDAARLADAARRVLRRLLLRPRRRHA